MENRKLTYNNHGHLPFMRWWAKFQKRREKIPIASGYMLKAIQRIDLFYSLQFVT